MPRALWFNGISNYPNEEVEDDDVCDEMFQIFG